MLTSYFDLVQHATAGGGASPHAMLGGPPQGLMHDPLFDAQGAGQAHPDLGANSMMWMLEQDERVVRGRALAAQARAEKARLAGNSKPTGRGSSPTPGGYGAIRSQNRDERVVRGRALAAKARAEKARLAGNTEPTGRGSGPTSVRISHITVEATGEYDIDTYRDLIARGVSVEIVARASAKAHFIRERKRRIAEGGL
jgi:hypothetical protein